MDARADRPLMRLRPMTFQETVSGEIPLREPSAAGSVHAVLDSGRTVCGTRADYPVPQGWAPIEVDYRCPECHRRHP